MSVALLFLPGHNDAPWSGLEPFFSPQLRRYITHLYFVPCVRCLSFFVPVFSGNTKGMLPKGKRSGKGWGGARKVGNNHRCWRRVLFHSESALRRPTAPHGPHMYVFYMFTHGCSLYVYICALCILSRPITHSHIHF